MPSALTGEFPAGPRTDSGIPGDQVISGWQRKHNAIAGAALVLFARDGYERTSVDAIAAEAGVSKRTVYSHYGDKENLFLLVLRETYDVMRNRISAIVNRTLHQVDNVEEALTAVPARGLYTRSAEQRQQVPGSSGSSLLLRTAGHTRRYHYEISARPSPPRRFVA